MTPSHTPAAAVKHSTRKRTLSGPPITRAAIAMDGGVADTPCYNRPLIRGGRGKVSNPPP